MASEQSFDYIVIGSGASGSIVASRLSADGNARVLLLEAGQPDTDPNIHDVGGFVQLWGSDLDWQIATAEQPGMNGRQIVINQGKVVGGSTAINAMMYVRGNPRNFDAWRDQGAEGWGYQDLLPYFKKSENYEGGASEYHGSGGPISVRDCPDEPMRSEAFLNGAVELGYDGPYWDYNGARQENGAGLLQFTINPDGSRCTTATAYLTPALERPNLTLRTGAQATRLLFDGKRVTGVEYRQDGQTRQANASQEVVISGGAFLSPKLLMLSGVGPADHLKEMGISVVVDLPGVGQNLQDHLQCPMVFRSKVDQEMPTLLTGNVLFVRTREDRKDAPPDLQLNFTPYVPKPLSPILDFGGPACIFLPILVQPDSIGEVKLRSADPQDPPVVNPNYLQEASDVQVFVEAARLIRSLTETKAFDKLNGGELAPGSDAELEPFIRSQASTLWHPVGTCQMGNGENAVVDAHLRVRGVEGLRVADASVMPIVPSGNTVAGCFAIGEKAADLILADR